MSLEKLCRKCDAPISGEVPGGFCTACLLEEALSPSEFEQIPITLRYFGDYELIEEIARGGMGVVFKARQRSLNRIVAVKMILSGHLASEAQAQRFRAEARAAAALQHPGIVAIHEVGEHDGLLFFSMDYIAGPNLAQQVRESPWAAGRAAQCVRDIAESIHYAHEQGVLHRDLKPSNVLIDADGKPHVTDFGLAKQLNPDSQPSTHDAQLTLSGQVLGSPNFMPPEQAAGKHHELTPAADVYSLGAILYHCLAARPPFVAETLPQTLRMLAEQEPVSPRLLNASVPRDLETICLKCLEKDPRRRYTTARDLADELGRFLRHEPIHARPIGVVLKVHRWCLRNKPLAISGTAILALLLVVAIGSPIAVIRINRERRQAQANEQKARMAAARSQHVAQFLKEMLKSAGPSVARGRDAAVLREILEATSVRVSSELRDQPEIQGDMYLTIGNTFIDIGEHRRAVTNYQQAVECYRVAFPGDHPNLAITLSALGFCQSFNGDFAHGTNNTRMGLEIARRCGDKEILFTCLWRYAGSFMCCGMFPAESEPYLREAYELKKRMGNDPVGLGMAMQLYAGTLTNIDEDEQLLREGLELYRKNLPAGHPKIIQGVFNLGQRLVNSGKAEEAERVLREAVEGFHATHNPNHPYQSIVLRFLAEALLLQEKGDEAEAIVREQLSATPNDDRHLHLLRLVIAFRRACALNSELLKNVEGDFLGQDWVLKQDDKTDSLARRGQWKEAAAEAARVLETEPSNHMLYHLLAPLLVASGDLEGYRRHGERIQKQFAGTQDPLVAERMAKACLILPDIVADFRRINQMVKVAVAADTNGSLFQYSLLVSGLSAFRQNDHTRALDTLHQLLNTPGNEPYPRIEAWTVFAMANHQLHRADEARTALTNGLNLARKKLPRIDAGDVGSFWSDKIIVQALFREARTLIDGKDPGESVYTLAEFDAVSAAQPADQWEAYCRAGKWTEATSSLRLAIEADPADHIPYLRLAPILLLTGDEAGYRQLCQRIVAQFSGTRDLGAADTVAKACTIHPRPGVDLTMAAQAAETAVTLGKSSDYFPWFALCKSLADYRQKQFAGAVNYAQKCLAAAGQTLERDATAYLVMAMAQMESKQDDAARIAFDKGAEIVQKKLPKLDSGDLGSQWVDLVIAHLLLREARTLVEGDSPKPSEN